MLKFVLGKFYGSNNVLEKHYLQLLSDKYVQLIQSIKSEDKPILREKHMVLEYIVLKKGKVKA